MQAEGFDFDTEKVDKDKDIADDTKELEVEAQDSSNSSHYSSNSQVDIEQQGETERPKLEADSLEQWVT